MLIDCNVQKLEDALDCFLGATGVCCSLLNEDFTYRYRKDNPYADYCRCIEQCREGFCGCRASDTKLLERCRESGQLELHVCHAGLIDAALPIFYNNSILGYVILGQMKQELDFSAVAARLQGLPLDLSEIEQHYKKLPCFSKEKIRSIAQLAALLTRYLILEDIVMPSVDRNMATVLEYIEQNLTEPLSVQGIAKSTSISASTLYRYFKQNFQCTVSEYITNRRLARSLVLLRSTILSIEEIAQQVGFSSTSYYSRSFKNLNGLSPLQYRKQQQK